MRGEDKARRDKQSFVIVMIHSAMKNFFIILRQQTDYEGKRLEAISLHEITRNLKVSTTHLVEDTIDFVIEDNSFLISISSHYEMR